VHLSVNLDSWAAGFALGCRAPRRTLAATLNRTSARRWCSIPASERWYIKLPAAPDIETTRCQLRSARRSPTSSVRADAMRFRALMNEVQMLLHEHPVNTEREARGRQREQLWLWGGGSLEPPSARPYSVVLAADPLARGLARAAGIASGRCPGTRKRCWPRCRRGQGARCA